VKEVTSAEVLSRIQDRLNRGHHVDERLIREVQAPGSLYTVSFEDQATFLSIIWQECDRTRILTPGGSRTLMDVAGRMVDNSWTFSSLCNHMGFEPAWHDPAAFQKFEAISSSFDLDAFDFIAVTPATDSERQQSPRGTLYIFDGVHRSLVLAHRLMTNQSKYRAIEGLLLTPRRN
jgi:hypothetical protein